MFGDLEAIEVEVTSWKLGKVLMAGPRVRKAHSTFQSRSNTTSTPTTSTNQHLIKTLMSLSVRLWYTATQASPPTPPSPRIFERTARVHHTPRHDSESQRQSIAPTSSSPPCTSSLVLNDTRASFVCREPMKLENNSSSAHGKPADS